MPSSRPWSNKVCVPNAYFMLPFIPNKQPLKPGQGRAACQIKRKLFIWYTLGFHHLYQLLASFILG